MPAKKTISWLGIVILILTMALTPLRAHAQETHAGHYAGSFFLSILLIPIKLVTCVGTQAVSAVAYTATYEVEGNYHGGTNGKEIGEVAMGSCRGSWVVAPDQLKSDYE